MGEQFDSIRTAVIANKVDGVVREMTNTLLRSARSAVINSARDFSCAITTGSAELLACAEGLPVHIFGSQLQAAALKHAHPDLRDGDAFLDNDPYTGNSHAADHTILVPIIIDDEHLFTAVVKAHQADIGNAIPTTYHSAARDVYEEGALIFPTVKVQDRYEDIPDIIRMCRSRIRVADQWYGDYLAMIGAARIAERRLKELVHKIGLSTIKQFMVNWLDYSETRMSNAISELPAATLPFSGKHDPFDPFLPEGLEFNGSIEIRPEEQRIFVDLRDNVDNVDCGLNLTEATARASVFAGIFNAIDAHIPKNSGAFRRVEIALKEGAAVGVPKFPHSCSIATTNLADRLVNAVGAAFTQLGAPHGVAEGAVGQGVGNSVMSGTDARSGSEFINQTVMQVNGGPASAYADGWLTWGIPVVSGLMYRDSVEIDELKMPVRYTHLKALPDTGGAGEHRGGAAFGYGVTPIADPVTIIYPCDGQVHPPKGVLGGADGCLSETWLEQSDGSRRKMPNNATVHLEKGQILHTVDSSGGGYGPAVQRAPQAVRDDVEEGWVSVAAAARDYGVALVKNGGSYEIDWSTTEELRGA